MQLDGASADCVTDYGKIPLDLLDYRVTPTQISYTIVLEESAVDLETRIFNHSESAIRIDAITISSSGGTK